MSSGRSGFGRALFIGAIAINGLFLSSAAFAQKLVVTAIAEKKISQLPQGTLYWRIETFPTPADAQASADSTALAAEIAVERAT